MDKYFYIDNDFSFSYSELLLRINSVKKIITNHYKFDDFDYFINLIAGLAYGSDMLILDKDFSDIEVIKACDGPYHETSISISSLDCCNLEDLLERVSKSKSKITMFTSGTTDVPKKIEHTIDTLIRNIKTGIKFKDDTWGFAYNPTHMAGMQVFFQAFFNNNTIVSLFGKNKYDIFYFIKKYQINHLSATPTFYRLLIPSQEKFISVKQITFGGEKSDLLLQNKVKEVFPNANIRNIYASTEAGALFSSKHDRFIIPENIKDKVKIIDGELYIHNSLLGKAVNFDDKNPWYATGDLIEFFDNNKKDFFITGRKSEIINVGGYKVNPNEVEAQLRTMIGIQNVKVYGIPNSILGNILCADIVASDKTISESDIKLFLTNNLQNFKVPRKIYFKDILKTSRSGKIDRKNAK